MDRAVFLAIMIWWHARAAEQGSVQMDLAIKGKTTPRLQREGGISTFLTHSFIDYLQHIGVDINTMYEPALIKAATASGGRVPIADCQMLLEHAINELNDPNLVLKMAERTQLKHFGLFGFAAMSSRTLNDAANMLLRFQSVIADVNTVQRHDRGDQVELHWLPHLGPPSPLCMQHGLGCWMVTARHLTHRSDLVADAHFSFARPDDLTVYQRVFGGALHFNAPVTKLEFPQSYMALPVAQSDPSTHSLLMGQLEKAFYALSHNGFVQRLTEHVAKHLSSNRVGIRQVAAAFGMSPRTLQYQLNADGYGYRNLLERIRQEHAEHYLAQTDLSLNEIAFMLGYSEQSPFQNAFKRWTGMSPGEFRKANEARASGYST